MNDVKTYALKCHSDRNQLYHDKPYSFHLEMVVKVAEKFIYLIPEKDREDVIAGCWVHDVIEDTGQTYNDVKRATNETVAEYAYSLTNEKGRNRKERANAKYYAGIRNFKHATFIKICDRYANMYYSKLINSHMFKVYFDEFVEFSTFLYKNGNEPYKDLWRAIEHLTYTEECMPTLEEQLNLIIL